MPDVKISARPSRIVAGRYTADDGLFGPDSITWKLHAQPSMAFVGILAATTQMLHPRVMRMIDQASSFRTHPESRGYQTWLYTMTITYGDVAAANRAAATLRRIHQHVKAIDPDTGREYNAEEPDLLIWVQNSLTYSAITVFSRYVPDLMTDANRDQYVDEQRTAGELIGMNRDDLPKTYAELQAYIDSALPRLATIPEALWFRDAMTSRTVAGAAKQKLPDYLLGRIIKDEALGMMVTSHRELFGISFPVWRRVAARVGASLLLKAAASKAPVGPTISKLREQVDTEAFGSPRHSRVPGGH
ncbi:oxygenase MpaB family protein [Subtercola vilae]|nr:oxygenase MpaB family protein [Subtercola vilae]